MQQNLQQYDTLTMQQFVPPVSAYKHQTLQLPWPARPLAHNFIDAPLAPPHLSHSRFAPIATKFLATACRPIPSLAPSSQSRVRTTPNRPRKLLPATASHAVSKPIVVASLGDRWLAGLLERLKIGRVQALGKAGHCDSLESLLGQEGASWLLASIALPSIALPSASSGTPLGCSILQTTAPNIAHVLGTIVYADLAFSHQVCFKLNDETVTALLDYHDSVHSTAMTAKWTNDREATAATLQVQERSRQAIHDFVFYTGKGCLEETGADGSGELCRTGPEEVKSAILALFQRFPPIVACPVREGSSQLEAMYSH